MDLLCNCIGETPTNENWPIYSGKTSVGGAEGVMAKLMCSFNVKVACEVDMSFMIKMSLDALLTKGFGFGR